MKKANCFIAFLIGFILVLTGCVSKSSICPIETLILNENLFPTGTHAEPLESPLPEFPKESAAQSFYYAPDSVYQEVVKFRSARAAKDELEYYTKAIFDVDKYMGPWLTPEDLYFSSFANNYRAACGIDGQIYQCRMLATYKGYFVFFRAEVSPQGITMTKVNELLQNIDQRMAECTDQ